MFKGWFQIWQVIDWASHPPTTLLHLCSYTSCRQNTFWVQIFVGGFLSLSQHWESYLTTGASQPLQAANPPLLGVSSKITIIDTLKSPSQISGISQRCLFPLPPPWVISIHSLSPLLTTDQHTSQSHLHTLYHNGSPFKV